MIETDEIKPNKVFKFEAAISYLQASLQYLLIGLTDCGLIVMDLKSFTSKILKIVFDRLIFAQISDEMDVILVSKINKKFLIHSVNLPKFLPNGELKFEDPVKSVDMCQKHVAIGFQFSFAIFLLKHEGEEFFQAQKQKYPAEISMVKWIKVRFEIFMD